MCVLCRGGDTHQEPAQGSGVRTARKVLRHPELEASTAFALLMCSAIPIHGIANLGELYVL